MIHLYFKTPPAADRYISGDRYVYDLGRRLLRRNRISGVKKVFQNLCLGFDKLKIKYKVNEPFGKIAREDAVIVLGVGRYSLDGYSQPNKIIAGIGLMTHPAEWPDLITDYPIAKYLQHSVWTNNVYAKYYGTEKCTTWPAGIDTNKWNPKNTPKTFDVLIYNKIMWNKTERDTDLLQPIISTLEAHNISHRHVKYGYYSEREYKKLLQNCRAMIFLCEHESQGFACCEALSMAIPVIAWDSKMWLDPNRFGWNDPEVPATSIPFFDERCGTSFNHWKDFDQTFKVFWQKVIKDEYHPREYIIENLTLEKSALRMLEIVDEVYNSKTTNL